MGGGMRVEEMGVGLKGERGMTEKKESEIGESAAFPLCLCLSRTHKSAGRQSGCSYAGKVPIK